MGTDTDQLEKILVVIVIYKSSVFESESYNSLREGLLSLKDAGKKVDLLVVNNGPYPTDCQVDEKIFQKHYIEQLHNPGVSKAYNLASELAAHLEKKWLLLLDQDTSMPINFWHYYSEALTRHPYQPLYAPKLYTEDILASPCGYRYYRGHVLDGIPDGITPMDGHNVLNSGLLIDVKAFQKVGGYDESVPLYFSDFVFFDRLKSVFKAFVVIDLKLMHSLSSSDYSSIDTAKYRFALYCQGAYAATKGEPIRWVMYFLTVGARSLLMNKRFNTLSFSKIFLNNWFKHKSLINL